MPDRRLYAVTIPDGLQVRAQGRTRQQQTLQSILGSDLGNVATTGTRPGERPLTVEWPDDYADLRAAEMDEIAAGIEEPVPYYVTSGTDTTDGYYSVSEASPGPVDPRSQKFQRVDATLTKEGTLASDWRAVETRIAQPDHPYGNDTNADVAVDANASKVRWYDPTTGSVEDASVTATRNAENATVDVYDATAASFTDPSNDVYPTLIYELDYDEEGWADPRVYDQRGNSSATDGNGALQWQKVFAPSHRFDGNPLVDNGLLRVEFDESNNTVSAEEWDDANSQWSSVSLGTSDWELFDADIREIGLARVRVHVEFRDPTQTPTAYYNLSMRLSRGDTDAMWAAAPDETGAYPSGLQTKLDPIAQSSIYDATESQGLLSRSEV